MAKKHLKPAKPAPAVKAVHVTTDSQRRAWAVADAISDLQSHLRPYRAIEALTLNEKLGSEESIGSLQRSDLAMLLCVLNTNVEQRCAEAREAAVLATKEMV